MSDLFGENNEVIRTLGFYQPYCTAMLHGKVETRWIIEGRTPPMPLGKYLLYSTKKSLGKQGVGILDKKYHSKIIYV